MRMPDGGTPPAYNVELATDCSSRAIVGVGDDRRGGPSSGQSAPMRDQVEERADEAIEEQLLDGSFVSLEGIERAAAEEVTIYTAVAHAAESRSGSPRPQADGQRGGGRVASADGYARGQATVQATEFDHRDGQRGIED